MSDPAIFGGAAAPGGHSEGGDSAIFDSAGGQRRFYNPYEHLQIPYGGGGVGVGGRRFEVSSSPEFLFQEESQIQRRSWGENLTYYTGVGYLSGAVGGAALGLRRASRAVEPGDSLKIRGNRVLNCCGEDGRRIGNRMGVIGLLYAGLESGMVAVRGDRDDWVNSVAAGLGTGVLFRAANGPRSAAIAGALGGLAVAAAVAGKQAVKRYVPI